jgi:hypothetical protein
MANTNCEQHTVDHLFLLVGENPLPNYVAAKLLVREKGIAHLVYSTRTKPEYDNLVKVLKAEGIKTQPVSLGQSEADGNEIQNQINKVLKPKGQPIPGRIGLNYTGGTKAMAVHAYQAIQSFDSPSKESKVFSYLDSRSLKLFVDGHRSEPVGLAVQPPPSLNTLLQLHNLSKIREPITQPQLTQAAFSFVAEFKKVSNSGSGNSFDVKQWKHWCKESFKKEKRSDGRWKDENELSKELSLNAFESVPQEFRRILRENLQSANDSQLRIDIARDRLTHPALGLTYIYHWLGGGWLEDYVLYQIQAISKDKPKYQIRETFMSLTIRDPEKSWKREQFEFDVGFLIDYQLFAISCTTSSSHDTCKQKLFEAQLRARQLGGDEARVALVSCYDQPTDWLRQELSLITGGHREEGQKYDKRVEVFGRDNLEPSRFMSKLDQWIYRNIRL